MEAPLRTNTIISGPILYPDEEIATFNGFALTDYGIVLQSSSYSQESIGGAAQWLGTQS